MNRLLILLLLVMGNSFMYAGSFGVTPSSTSPNEPHAAKTKSISVSKHKKKGGLALFKHKKKAHKLKRKTDSSNWQHQTSNWKDWPDFWHALPWMLLILGSLGLILAGIVLSTSWMWILGAALLGAFWLLFIFIMYTYTHALDWMGGNWLFDEWLYNNTEAYLYITLILGVLAGALLLGVFLNVLWLAVLGTVLFSLGALLLITFLILFGGGMKLEIM